MVRENEANQNSSQISSSEFEIAIKVVEGIRFQRQARGRN